MQAIRQLISSALPFRVFPCSPRRSGAKTGLSWFLFDLDAVEVGSLSGHGGVRVSILRWCRCHVLGDWDEPGQQILGAQDAVVATCDAAPSDDELARLLALRIDKGQRRCGIVRIASRQVLLQVVHPVAIGVVPGSNAPLQFIDTNQPGPTRYYRIGVEEE